MSYVGTLAKAGLFSIGVAFAAGCGASDEGAAEVGSSEAALDATPTMTFDGAWNERISGALQKGKKLRVVYAPERLTQCRGDINGGPGWAITGFWRIGDGPIRTFEAGGLSPSNGSDQTLTLDASGELQMWFQNTSRWGCSQFDSNLGANYRFAVAPAAHEPGWIGNARFAIDRTTCDGICESSLREINGDIPYDTGARQRAAIRVVTFEVWKEGVTDRDNPDLWRNLDVQVFSRVGNTGAFVSSYVAFDKRVGNNARYALDLRGLDPIPGLFTIQDASDCPAFDLAISSNGDGALVDAVVELYFSINGVELRPSGGQSVFRVRYSNYKGLFAPCVQ